MSQKDCIARFLGKVNAHELLELQQDFKERGQDENTAMISAVEEKLAELRDSEKQIVAKVREAAGMPSKAPIATAAAAKADQIKFSRSEAPQNAEEFVQAPDGSQKFGEITDDMGKAMKRQAGEIRLQQGVQRDDNTGFGLAHIEARHGAQIRGMGFNDLSAFVHDALQNIDQIWKPGKTSQLIAMVSGVKGRAVYLELKPSTEGGKDFYTVNSAFPVGDHYADRKEEKEGWKPLWSRDPVPADASGASGFAQQSPKAGETAPMVSPSGDAIVQASELPDNLGGDEQSKPQDGEDEAPQLSRSTGPQPGLTRTAFSTAMAQAFGEKVAQRLEEKGVVVPLEDQSKLPDHVVPFLREGDTVYGFYDPKTDRTYAVLANLTPEMVKGLALHEVGVHYGFENMLGAEKYDQVMKQLDVLRRAGDARVKEAHAQATREAVRPKQIPEETLAYLVQNHPDMPLVQRIVAAVKAFLYREFGIGGKYLTPADLTMLARAAVDHASRTEPGGSMTRLAPQFSRATVAGATTRTYTPEQQAAFRNVGFETQQPTLKERAQALWKDAGKKLAQGVADQFAPVADLTKEGYTLLRLSKGSSGAFEALLRGGQLKLTDNVYDIAKRGGVVDDLLIPLQGEHHDFLRWIAANRAEKLASQGKEHLFTAADIAALKSLDKGTTDFDYTLKHDTGGKKAGTVTRDRTLIYPDSLKTFNEFNRNVLDMAEQSGLIDPEARKLWESEFYVPFYRVADEQDGGVRGMNIKGGVVRQQAFKALKGGTDKLNADLLDNTLMNWAHLLDAAAKNRAAKATLEAAQNAGIAIEAPEATAREIGKSTGNKNGVVWFMDHGRQRSFVVDDPYILAAISSLEYAGMRGPVMNAMGAMKHALTVGVTSSPFFKVRNLIRDSVQAIASAPLDYNPAKNVAQGWKLTNPESDEFFRLLAGGGTIHFGSMLEGNEAKRVQGLVESGIDDATILNSDTKFKAFYRKYVEPGVHAYKELGDRGEAINRASLYDQLRKQGLSHADASLQARDLMDFSMQGSWSTIRFLTQVVPFLNARIQGLYKLGKAAKEDPQRFAIVLGATALASLGLLAAYHDDEDWKKREESDRNNFWWFKLGGTAFRIPKPFEIGAIATLAERGFELAFEKEMTGKRFRNQVLALLGDNLSMNPIPQLVKPMLDVYANQDSFTGRPIETLGMEKLKSDYRFNGNTSMVARALSTGMNAVTGTVGKEALSPVQIDHLLRGYFGWLGSFVVGTADLIAKPATGQPDRPSPDIWKTATGGMVSDLRDAPSRYVSQMYTQAKEIEQAYGTWRAMLKEGKREEAGEFLADNRGEITQYKSVEALKRAEAKFNERIRIIERSNMQPEEKRDLIRSINREKDRVARLTPA